jgi:hypothetical protein
MKKLLGLFSAISVVATAGSSVVSCFNYKVLPNEPKEIDLQIDFMDYPKYDPLEDLILEPYEDYMLPTLYLFTDFEMAKSFVDSFNFTGDLSTVAAPLKDSMNFKKHYSEKYSDITVIGYGVMYYTDDSKPVVVYGTITNVPVDNNEKI